MPDWLAILKAYVDTLETIVGTEGGVALANKLTAARAALLDEITVARGLLVDRLSIITAGGAGELTAARAALLSNLDALVSSRLATASYTAERGTDNAALAADWTNALATALGSYTAARAAYLDNLIGTVTTGTFALVANTNEQDLLVFAAANQIIEVELDVNALAQLNTIREHVQVNGAAYRQISAKVFSTDFDAGTKCVLLSFTQKNSLYKITIQSAVSEGGVNIPYRQIVRDLS